MVYAFVPHILKDFVNSELWALYTPKFCRTVALIQKGTQTIVLPSGNLYASDFCMGNLNNRLRSANVRFSKLKMPKFTHFSMEANGSQCIRTGARRKTCVVSLVECPCNNVRFQSRSSIVSMVISSPSKVRFTPC